MRAGEGGIHLGGERDCLPATAAASASRWMSYNKSSDVTAAPEERRARVSDNDDDEESIKERAAAAVAGCDPGGCRDVVVVVHVSPLHPSRLEAFPGERVGRSGPACIHVAIG